MKVAIVTGGSRGIGAATVKALANQGYAVCINYHQGKLVAEQLVSEILAERGQAIAVQADMGNEAAVIRLFEETDRQLGPVTALVNNAGINGGTCAVENVTWAVLQKTFNTNFFGTVIATREAIKRMKVNQGGSIVNISSEAARFGGTQLSHYAASKAAINTFTIGCAREVAQFGIRVNTVSPGVIETDMHADSSTERLQNLLKTLPMKRMGTADEVAELICWLLSDKSSYMSGAILPVTGAR